MGMTTGEKVAVGAGVAAVAGVAYLIYRANKKYKQSAPYTAHKEAASVIKEAAKTYGWAGRRFFGSPRWAHGKLKAAAGRGRKMFGRFRSRLRFLGYDEDGNEVYVDGMGNMYLSE